jgi:hypothetical protein
MAGRSIARSNVDASDKEVVELLQAESEAYRATVQVALQKLAETEKRLENALKANRTCRERERAANEHDTHR